MATTAAAAGDPRAALVVVAAVTRTLRTGPLPPAEMVKC